MRSTRSTGSATDDHRSGCPINLAIEVIGDKWSLLIVRDMIFGERHRYGELLAGSNEGIATNILADRLKRLVAQGMITRRADPGHPNSARYDLTEPAIELVPVLAALGAWGRRNRPASRALSIRAQVLEDGGPELWDAFMDELREQHLGSPRVNRSPSVSAQLRAAYEEVIAEESATVPRA
ncbi:winged helix-turn-helix transcriptional regulator [Rathayibacter soli]|uniref:winged helix-turn-helix transcriptional regulator n=1 Tax=Rathayibacter soli TaxID=3144168 RepID=UPI0027E487A0|nr:helix-turn-helix domain-containing protein [Glaciibacter superstes]